MSKTIKKKITESADRKNARVQRRRRLEELRCQQHMEEVKCNCEPQLELDLEIVYGDYDGSSGSSA